MRNLLERRKTERVSKKKTEKRLSVKIQPNENEWYSEETGNIIKVVDIDSEYYVLAEDYDHPSSKEVPWLRIKKEHCEIVTNSEVKQNKQ